jgi:short-subunit dehydrogenase
MSSNKPASPPIIWLVGASQGIGLSLVRLLLNQGFLVIASARSAESSPPLQQLAQQSDNIRLLNIDISDIEDCKIKAYAAWQLFGKIDIWFYNVGAYQPMRIDEWQWDQFVTMNQSNYLGAVALMIALQPLFAQQQGGRWIWNISLASYFGLPYGGGYSAPKAALANLAESLHPELAAQDIQLQIINHGFVKTRLTTKNSFPMPGLLTAEQAARLIVRGMASRHFEIRFPLSLRLPLSLLRLLPYRFALALTRRML